MKIVRRTREIVSRPSGLLGLALIGGAVYLVARLFSTTKWVRFEDIPTQALEGWTTDKITMLYPYSYSTQWGRISGRRDPEPPSKFLWTAGLPFPTDTLHYYVLMRGNLVIDAFKVLGVHDFAIPKDATLIHIGSVTG